MDVKLSNKQKKTIEMIRKMEDHFGVRWFVQSELLGVTLHTMDALVKKEYLEVQYFEEIPYYRFKG